MHARTTACTARFDRLLFQVVDLTKEHLVRAQSQRPNICLWGNARRPNIYDKTNVVLSFTPDLCEWVKPVYNDLKIRGFPVWMDLYESGANGIAGLESAAMIVCFLSPKYNESEHTCNEYSEATKRNIPKLHIWYPHHNSHVPKLALAVCASLVFVRTHHAARGAHTENMKTVVLRMSDHV
jgi:hypothetical protein